MPAFNLKRLNGQLDELSWKYTRPVEFQQDLRDILEKYADWAYKPGKAVQQGLLIPSYHIQPLILQKVEQMLVTMSQENPDAGLALADVLWKDEYLEPRLIALSILGKAPLDSSENVVKRLREWSNPSEPVRLLDELFTKGADRLRREMPEIWLGQIESWASHIDLLYQEISLRAMLATISDREFENLPPIFRMLGILMKKPVERLQIPILDVLEALVERSNLETQYFLRQMAINESENQVVLNHVRRSLRFFDEPTRLKLRRAVFDTDYFEEIAD